MSEEKRKILDMLAAGKISVDEAERLLSAVGSAEGGPVKGGGTSAKAGKYLRVAVNGGDDKVDVRVPLALVRAGMKFNALIPESARGRVQGKLNDKGIDIDLTKLKPSDLDELVTALSDLTVDVNSSDGETVRVWCE